MKKNGFTLIELMIYVAISTVIMFAVYSAVELSQRTSSSLGRKTITQQDARLVLDMMAMDIRNASYNRWHQQGIWRNLAGGFAANMLLAGIQVADQNNILVEMDLNEDRIIGPPGTNEHILYSYDIPNNTITRLSNWAGGPQVLLGGTNVGGAGGGTLVRNNRDGVPLFQYFISNPIPANRGPFLNPTAAQIPQIRVIRITIVAETEGNDLNTHAPRIMHYSTDVVVKNHAVAGYTVNN